MDSYDVPVSYSQADNWWLRSPWTDNPSFAWYVRSSGLVSSGDYLVWGDSYGRVSTTLRTPIMTVMRVMWTRMVTSTTAIGISIIPTAKLITGGFALRAPTSTTLVWSARVASSTTTSMWRIPTTFLHIFPSIQLLLFNLSNRKE